MYRDHVTITDGDYAKVEYHNNKKDISKIGRNLAKMIIIDSYAQNFRFQKEDGILIKSFYGKDDDDNALIDLISILISKVL